MGLKSTNKAIKEHNGLLRKSLRYTIGIAAAQAIQVLGLNTIPFIATNKSFMNVGE